MRDLNFLKVVDILGNEAYGAAIHKYIEDNRTELSVFWPMSLGRLYSDLNRLVEQGFLTTMKVEGTAERGGREKLYWKLTDKGRAHLGKHRFEWAQSRQPLHQPAMHGSVFQPWVMKYGWKMQSILVNGLRAPDVATKAVKKCVRWMRVMSCNNADPTKPNCYMSAPVLTEELVKDAMDELEYLTCHYVHHFADAMRIIALFHPEANVRMDAYRVHILVAVEIFHFKPETDEEFKVRHRDKVPEGTQPVMSSPTRDEVNELDPSMREFWVDKPASDA